MTKKLHSLGSLEYLKIDASNHIRVMDVGADSVISIQDQYLDKEDKTQFIDLYRVKLFSLKLRELLLLQSLFGAHGE